MIVTKKEIYCHFLAVQSGVDEFGHLQELLVVVVFSHELHGHWEAMEEIRVILGR